MPLMDVAAGAEANLSHISYVSRRLRAAGLRTSSIPATSLNFSDRNKADRLTWCEEMQQRDEDFWASVIFTDEKWMRRSGDSVGGVTPSGVDHRLDAARHGGRQTRKEVRPRPEPLPLRLHSLPELVGRQAHLIDVVVRELLCQPRPDVLDDVQIGTLGWPGEDHELPSKKGNRSVKTA